MATRSVGQAERRPVEPEEGASSTESTRQLAPQLAAARDKVIYFAAAESAALANMLHKQNDNSSEFAFVLPGALKRIEALGTAVCSLLNNDSVEDIAEEYHIVFGEKLEVSHG